MAVRTQILDAGQALAPWRHELEDLAAQALTAIGRLLPLTDLDVLVFPSTLVIPELGLRTHRSPRGRCGGPAVGRVLGQYTQCIG